MGRLLFRVPSLLGLYGIPVVYVFASYVCFGVQPAEVLTSIIFASAAYSVSLKPSLSTPVERPHSVTLNPSLSTPVEYFHYTINVCVCQPLILRFLFQVKSSGPILGSVAGFGCAAKNSSQRFSASI